MEKLVEELKKQREQLRCAKEIYAGRLAAFQIEQEELTSGMDIAKTNISELTDQISTAALKEYDANHNNKPYPGIGIRITKKLDYGKDEAIAWAKAHDLALNLNVREFESLAKAKQLDFVKTVEVPKVTFSATL